MYPPAQDHLVCHLSVLPLRPSTPVHCDPDVASALPQRFLVFVSRGRFLFLHGY
jgi:hypothetical protein